MLKDILGQAWEAMLFNRRRTAITMIGMAWGIATVVLLLAYGAGFSRAIEAIFAQWGTNIIGVFPGTNQPAGRRRQGRRQGPLHPRRCGPRHRSASRTSFISRPPSIRTAVQNDLHTYTWTVVGSRPSYADIIKLDSRSGPLLQWRGGRPARPRLRPRL